MISADLVFKHLKNLQGFHYLLIHMFVWGGSGGRGYIYCSSQFSLIVLLFTSSYWAFLSFLTHGTVSQSAMDSLSQAFLRFQNLPMSLIKLVRHLPQPELYPWASRITDSPICFLPVWTHLADKSPNQDYPVQQQVYYYYCGILLLSGKTTIPAIQTSREVVVLEKYLGQRHTNSCSDSEFQCFFKNIYFSVYFLPLVNFQSCEKIVFHYYV